MPRIDIDINVDGGRYRQTTWEELAHLSYDSRIVMLLIVAALVLIVLMMPVTF